MLWFNISILKVIDGKSKFQTLTLSMQILSLAHFHIQRARARCTQTLKLQSDIYWQNAYAFMCRIGMNHSLQEIWKFTTGNTIAKRKQRTKQQHNWSFQRKCQFHKISLWIHNYYYNIWFKLLCAFKHTERKNERIKSTI